MQCKLLTNTEGAVKGGWVTPAGFPEEACPRVPVPTRPPARDAVLSELTCLHISPFCSQDVQPWDLSWKNLWGLLP